MTKTVPNHMNTSADQLETIYKEATSLYRSVKDLPYPSELEPTKGWQNIVSRISERGVLDKSNLVEAVHFIQDDIPTSTAHHNDDPLTHKLIDRYCRWFESQSAPIAQLDPRIRESELTSPNLIVDLAGRPVSPMFFWHLGFCHRILANAEHPIRRVLEIGGGYGGLARMMKLLQPNVQYVILDLPEQLFFTHLFLRGSFPNARFQFVDRKGPVAWEGFDFVLVPVPFIDGLAGTSFDLVANTASFGEMTQQAVNRYMRFIHNEIHTRYFYSVNRYGRLPFELGRVFRAAMDQVVKVTTGRVQYSRKLVGSFLMHRIKAGLNVLLDFPPREFATGDGCDCTVILDPHWDVKIWNFLDGHFQIEPASPAYLEIFAERQSRTRDVVERKRQSDELLNRAKARLAQDVEWQRMVWESVRLAPSIENLRPYVEFLKRKHYLEYAHYDRIVQRIQKGASFGPELLWS